MEVVSESSVENSDSSRMMITAVEAVAPAGKINQTKDAFYD